MSDRNFIRKRQKEFMKQKLQQFQAELDTLKKEKAELIEWLTEKKDDLDYDKMSHQLTGLRILTFEQRIAIQLTLQSILKRLGVEDA